MKLRLFLHLLKMAALLHSYSLGQRELHSSPNQPNVTVQWPPKLLIGHEMSLGHQGVGELWTQPGQKVTVNNLHPLCLEI